MLSLYTVSAESLYFRGRKLESGPVCVFPLNYGLFRPYPRDHFLTFLNPIGCRTLSVEASVNGVPLPSHRSDMAEILLTRTQKSSHHPPVPFNTAIVYDPSLEPSRRADSNEG